jgi:hypothetical protein
MHLEFFVSITLVGGAFLKKFGGLFFKNFRGIFQNLWARRLFCKWYPPPPIPAVYAVVRMGVLIIRAI